MMDDNPEHPAGASVPVLVPSEYPAIHSTNQNSSDLLIPMFSQPVYIQSEFDLRPVTSTSMSPLPLVLSEGAIDSHRKRFIVQPVVTDVTPVSMIGPEQIDSAMNLLPTLSHASNEDQPNSPPKRKISSSSSKRSKHKSEWEIHQTHKEMQKKHQRTKKPSELQTNLTDIDFEGILKIIGGCNIWQILIYLMISAHQIPHAMFNLSVVYYIYQPDHWCKINNFSRSIIERHENATKNGWTWEKVLRSNIAYRTLPNNQRRGNDWHDQCLYFNRPPEEYADMLNQKFDEVKKRYENPNVPKPQLKRCTAWEYENDVMKNTIVTQWNRVCDDNWSRAHVHLSYSFGYLFGCVLGGFISDRYGRKPAIYGFSILSTIFGFLLPFSNEFEVFLIVRFLLATCNEASDLAAYVMCMEWTGVKYRSIVGSLLQAPWACGNVSKRWHQAASAVQTEASTPNLATQKNVISEPLSVNIRGTNMSVDEQKQCVEIANIALDKQGIENEIATDIKTKLDEITHDTWHVIVGRNFGTHISFTKYIHFAAAKITILVFQC